MLGHMMVFTPFFPFPIVSLGVRVTQGESDGELEWARTAAECNNDGKV